MPTIWTETEDRLTVEAYFDMLASELKGEAYNKSAFRRSVLPHLNDRSHGSLELKNQNISAVLGQLMVNFVIWKAEGPTITDILAIFDEQPSSAYLTSSSPRNEYSNTC